MQLIPMRGTLPRGLSLDDEQRILEAIDNAEFKEYVYTCLYTGARRTEVAMLQWSDFQRTGETWYIKITVSKTRSKTIPVAENLRGTKVATEHLKDAVNALEF